jgi:SAM-dependent methyltransferase
VPRLDRRPDRERLGAYDTPRDVAAYLAGSAIIPALLEAVRVGGAAFDDGFRDLLRRDPGRYLRPELKHGMARPLPPGLDPEAPADPAVGLPLETWGETAARRGRCAELLERLGGAGGPGIRDLVMDNLDLQRLAEDGLAWIPGLAPVFRRALEGLTVLDPTCGSGAFLAAAADVLEPLCAACGAEPRFKNHLYGVDLHEDAVARCRRRLEQRLGGPVPDGNLRVGDALLDSGPFWSSAFPAVMAAGGFDVILGNPPFARIPREASRPLLRADYRSARPRWSADESLATLAVERCLRLLKPGTGRLGLVLPLAVACSTEPAFATLRRVIATEPGLWLWSHFDRTPNALFGRGVRARCSLVLYARSAEVPGHQWATTGLLRWRARARGHLFATLRYARLDLDISAGIPKVASQLQADVLQRLLAAGPPLGMDLGTAAAAGATVYVGGSACNWFPAWRELPETFDRRGRTVAPARVTRFACADAETADLVFALLCSSLGYWWWAVASDGFNLKQWLVRQFPLALGAIPQPARRELAGLGRSLALELRNHAVHKDNRGRIGNFRLPACAAEILAIDRCLASVPGLSPAFMADIRASNAAFSSAGNRTGGPDCPPGCGHAPRRRAPSP